MNANPDITTTVLDVRPEGDGTGLLYQAVALARAKGFMGVTVIAQQSVPLKHFVARTEGGSRGEVRNWDAHETARAALEDLCDRLAKL
jgi:hypothetical protein